MNNFIKEAESMLESFGITESHKSWHYVRNLVIRVWKAAEQSVHLTRFPQCQTCEYNPCDLANNSDYCPARK